MLEVKITVIIPGLMELANAIAGTTVKQTEPVQTQQTAPDQVPQQVTNQTTPQTPVQNQTPAQPVPVQAAPQSQMSAQQMPQQNQGFGQYQAPGQAFAGAAPVSLAPPMQPVPVQSQSMTAPASQPVPTSHVSQQYTQDQLAIAMTNLMDRGKPQVVADIMGRLGVQTLMQVPKDRYPELALMLREAGAQI